MACGMYYKVPAAKPIVKTYGHAKKDKDQIDEIVRRMQTPINLDKLATAEVAMRNSASAGSNHPRTGMSLFQSKARSLQLAHRLLSVGSRTQQQPSIMDDRHIDKIFKRIQRANTKSWQMHLQKENPNSWATSSARAAMQRPKSAASAERPSYLNSLQFEVRTKELELEKKRRMDTICKHTQVSVMKQRGVCAFCQESKARQHRIAEEEVLKKQSGTWSPADEEEKNRFEKMMQSLREQRENSFQTEEEEEKHVKRMQVPTKASQGGQPACEKYFLDNTKYGNFKLSDRNLPLLSGLGHTDRIPEIFDRMHRCKSAIH